MMVINGSNNTYGQIATPSETNSDYTAVAAALGGQVSGLPTGMLTGAWGSINCNGADALTAPGGVYGSGATMQKGQPL